jgi:hypothetical protein
MKNFNDTIRNGTRDEPTETERSRKREKYEYKFMFGRKYSMLFTEITFT